MDSTGTRITKETKNRIRVDYEGKLSFGQRIKKKLTTSNTWIKVLINVFRFVMMLGVSYVILYPFIARIAGSFMSREDVIDATVSLIPRHFTLEIYKALIIENQYFEALLNTALLSLMCALLQTFIACLIGYGLAKFKFKGNNLVMILVVITMAIPHRTIQMALQRFFTDFDILKPRIIPKVMSIINYITQGAGGEEVFSPEQIDSFKGIIGFIRTKMFDAGLVERIPFDMTYGKRGYICFAILSLTGLAFKNGLYIYMMRQFFKGVPDELEESAYVDGCGVFRTFFKIILPLSIPMMITIFLFAFSWQWTDEYYTSMFFTSKLEDIKVIFMSNVYQVPDSLRDANFAGQVLYSNVIQNTGGLLIIMPLVILYLFCQRYLVQGIERSGLVG